MNNLFNKVYNKIISQQNLIDPMDQRILDFYMSSEGQEIQKKIQDSFFLQLQKYQSKYPQFLNIELEFDFDPQNYDDPQNEVYYAQLMNPGQNNPRIKINVYSIFAYVMYGKKLSDMLKWHHRIHFTLAHQLAHILDFMNRDYSEIETTQMAHDQNFDKYFFKLTRKHLSEVPDDI